MYILKEDSCKEIREKYRNQYIANTIGISSCYISLIMNRKRKISKFMAYAFTKCINKEYEIEDLFERV